jgi:hypothetical protein
VQVTGRPACFGILHDATNLLCQSCLVNVHCARERIRNTNHSQGVSNTKDVEIPKTRAGMIFAVCKKYGLPLEYIDRNGVLHTITDENYRNFGNLDFLLTTKAALEILLRTELTGSQSEGET